MIEAESGAEISAIRYVLSSEEVGVKLTEVKRAFAHVEIEPVDGQEVSIGELCRLGNVFPWKKSCLRHPA